MFFPEIGLRSSTASAQNLLPDRSSNLYFSGSKQNYQRHSTAANSSEVGPENSKHSYSKSNNPFEVRSSLHEPNFALAKKNMIKRSERNFPKDFFENIFKNNSKSKVQSPVLLENNNTPSFFSRNNSCLIKQREGINNYQYPLREKTQPDELPDSILYRHQNKIQLFSKNNFLNMIENSIKKLKNDQTDLLRDYIQKTEVNLEDSDIMSKDQRKKKVLNNPKLVSKSHPLKPIIHEKSQSTQENSKTLTDNENEFLENCESEEKSKQTVHEIKNEEKKQTQENKNWGAMFTFYNNTAQETKPTHESGEEISRKTGDFTLNPLK